MLLKRSRDRIGDINAQVEDTLAGIRVVKSFTNEELRKRNFSMKITVSLKVEEMATKMKPISTMVC